MIIETVWGGLYAVHRVLQYEFSQVGWSYCPRPGFFMCFRAVLPNLFQFATHF